MIAGEGNEIINRTAREIYEFVLDPEKYRQADRKIGTVYSIAWTGSRAEIHYSGRFRGFQTPSVRQVISVEPYRRIDIRSKPGTVGNFLSRFHGLFTFEELDAGATRVYHREELTFRAPFKWLLEPLLRGWIENDTPQEMLRLKQLLEGPRVALQRG